MRRSFLLADAVVVATAWERAYLDRWLGIGSKVHVVPLGLPDDYLAACDAVAEETGGASGRRDVACIEIAVLKKVEVRVGAPVAGRRIADGAS